jgi:hypothetical protein
MVSYEEYIRSSVLEKKEVDTFLDPDEPTWAQFDGEVGYILGNYMPRDGLDGSLTISTSMANGARRSIIYADRPCRINTYGNSFTQCHQVSDHKTWQEYLVAHWGEPVRNFGMGGFGTFQAYRRMLRTEASDDSAENVLMYIWGDDHVRSVLRCRHVFSLGWHRQHRLLGGRMLHGNFWSNLEMDLDSGKLVGKDSILSTPEALYKMTDADFMVQALRHDLMLQMGLFCREDTHDIDKALVNRLAQWLGCAPVTADSVEAMRPQVDAIRQEYAFSATRHIIDRTMAFGEAQGKKILFVLFCPRAMRQLITTGERYDQAIVDYLKQQGIPYFDMNRVHVEDFKQFNLPLEDYLKRYFIGHYSPAGNHFFVFSIKQRMVDWLEPKPITYRGDDAARIDFREGYLPK